MSGCGAVFSSWRFCFLGHEARGYEAECLPNRLSENPRPPLYKSCTKRRCTKVLLIGCCLGGKGSPVQQRATAVCVLCSVTRTSLAASKRPSSTRTAKQPQVGLSTEGKLATR